MGAFFIVMGITDGNKTRIPVPLLRIRPCRKFRVAVSPVAIQDPLGLLQIFSKTNVSGVPEHRGSPLDLFDQ